MPTPIDPKRLPTLRAALKRFKPGEKVPQQNLAKIYGVTNARFTTLAKQRFENFPPAERHEDKTHWYEAVPAIQSMIAYLTNAGAKKRASARRAAAILGEASEEAQTTPEPQELPPPTPAELDKLASAETRTFRLEQEKKQFVRADVARAFIRDLFNAVQRQVGGLATEIDPNGELPPEHRQRLESSVRFAMVKIHETVKAIVDDAA
jgi:hypothetical protein